MTEVDRIILEHQRGLLLSKREIDTLISVLKDYEREIIKLRSAGNTEVK
jgi:hypothetical protein